MFSVISFLPVCCDGCGFLRDSTLIYSDNHDSFNNGAKMNLNLLFSSFVLLGMDRRVLAAWRCPSYYHLCAREGP